MRQTAVAQAILVALLGSAIVYSAQGPLTSPYRPEAAGHDLAAAVSEVPACSRQQSRGRVIFMLCKPSATSRDFRATGAKACDMTGKDPCLVFFWTDPAAIPLHVRLALANRCVAVFTRQQGNLQHLALYDPGDC